MATRQLYLNILDHFPKKHLRMAFAYGSGAFQQKGDDDMSKNMLDFIFAVDDAEQWHKENIACNGRHYSFLKYLGPKYIANIQDNTGARVYFNTLVKCEGRLIKYGVISTQSLMTDLLDWETMYISGRLHKPVAVIHKESSDSLDIALKTNLQSAVNTALLMLNDTFTEEELYCKIASLSYTGDFRMTLGEDKNKVINIVKPNIGRFRKLYEDILDSEQHIHWNRNERIFEQSLDAVSNWHHLNMLPKMLMFALVAHRNMDGRARDTEEVLRSISHDPECDDIVQECISGIVKQSSWSQSTKSIFTAGLVKSCVYSLNKMKKMWKSIKFR